MKDYRKKIERRLALLATASAKFCEERDALTAIQSRIRALEQAQTLTQKVAEQVQNKAHAQISRLVTRCLESVFDEPYTFKILFEKKRGRTEARFVFERDGLEVDPLTASGGGVVDVAAFALREAARVLSKPHLRGFLVLDEPFRFARPEIRERIQRLLLSLSKETGTQILLVTHDSELRAGKIRDLGDSKEASP